MPELDGCGVLRRVRATWSHDFEQRHPARNARTRSADQQGVIPVAFGGLAPWETVQH
jgi:hypothetical protein